jgi:hypothetical protein
VRASGKPAKTLLKRLRHVAAKGYSIVECHPFTGRTHQIRVHLQYLGHPIVNDPVCMVVPLPLWGWLLTERRYTVIEMCGDRRWVKAGKATMKR